jgi:CRP-like cAMP-binding protein
MVGDTVPRNALLGALTDTDWQRMSSNSREVPLNSGTVLLRADDPYQQVLFPLAGVVSSVALFKNGASSEMATIGAEGMVDIGAILGSATALSRHTVQVPGTALAVDHAVFRHWQQECPAFRKILLDYAQAFLCQVLQSVACNAVHSVRERAARWLLTCDDRSGASHFVLTQQFLGEMLGASRGMVSAVALSFQRAGFIRYSRGLITIQDRAGLERTSCECYRTIRQAYVDRSLRLHRFTGG